MDFKKLAEMAKVQSSLEDEAETSVPSESPANSESSDSQQYDMYIPIDNDDNEDPNQIPDDGYISSTGDNENSEVIESIIEKCFPDEKAYNIDLDRLLPFRFPIFNGDGDISALKSSIARIGITEPLLVRSAGNGEYEILNGARRKRAAEELLWVKVPCRIADNDLLSDENEKLIVVESNRSRLSDLRRLSEKVRVLSILGKDSASELEIPVEQVDTYIQLNQLEQDFLEMLDDGKISLEAAEELSSLSEKQQKQTLGVLEQHSECKITTANAKELAQSKRLTADSIAKILKPKPPVNVAISAEIISEYMGNKSPEEISELVTKAICKYFEEETNGKN